MPQHTLVFSFQQPISITALLQKSRQLSGKSRVSIVQSVSKAAKPLPQREYASTHHLGRIAIINGSCRNKQIEVDNEADNALFFVSIVSECFCCTKDAQAPWNVTASHPWNVTAKEGRNIDAGA